MRRSDDNPLSAAITRMPAHDRYGKLETWLSGHTHTTGRR